MRNVLLPLLALGLISCTGSAPPPPADSAARPPTVIDDHLKAIDKAKAVEQDVMEAKERMDAEMEEQGG